MVYKLCSHHCTQLKVVEGSSAVVHSDCYNKTPQTGWLANNRSISQNSVYWEFQVQDADSVII